MKLEKAATNYVAIASLQLTLSQEGREREGEREREREREREKERERETEGRLERVKAMIAKKSLNKRERYAYHSGFMEW